MIDALEKNTGEFQEKNIEQYYDFHARFYDATRWCFLFGRKTILDMIPDLPPQPKILEIGCGTGYNIRQLENYYPNAQVLGVDLSPDMLKIAQNKIGDSDRVDLLEASYGSDPLDSESFDLILLSYSLTMMSQQYEDLICEITHDLCSDGIIAVVDFHNSPFGWFRRWMDMNHVDINGSLLPQLQKHFSSVKTEVEVKQAYGGLWTYFKFVGRQR